MSNNGFFQISQSDRKDFCETIIDSSAPNADFYFLVVLSALIVSFGLAKDNVVLVIGGMLITPILSSILAISIGMVILNFKVFFRSVKVLTNSVALAILVSFFVGLIGIDTQTINLFKYMEASYFTLAVAIVAGTAASYTWAKPNLSSTLPGIAITVTLIPPIAAIGLALANLNYPLATVATYSLILNIFGIIFSSLFVFFLLQFYKAKRKILSEMNEEERELAKQ